MKARFNVKGNLMFDQLAADLDFGFSRCGSYVIAFDDEGHEDRRHAYGTRQDKWGIRPEKNDARGNPGA